MITRPNQPAPGNAGWTLRSKWNTVGPACLSRVVGMKSALDKRTPLRTLCRVTTVTATEARGNLYALIDEANASHEPIQITGKRGNAVLIAEDDWRSIRETLYLHGIPAMVESIEKARKEGIKKASKTLDW